METEVNHTTTIYPASGTGRKKPVILCVDDEQMVLQSLKSQLKRSFGSEFIIETVDSAEEAIDLFREFHGEGIVVPVVISDQIMPGMKGDEFLREIHQMSDRTLKILLTGQASMEAIGNAVNFANLYRYIAKPWEQTDLNLTVTEAIRCYFQNQQVEVQNQLLKEYAERLEEKIRERTQEIARQKAELEVKNNDITSSINYACRIQQAMLPSLSLIKSKLPDSFVFFRPRDIVSGDFYWFSYKQEKIFLAVADCTGHGVPGGFMSIIGQNLLNDIINKQKISHLSEVLRKLDEGLKQILQHDISQVNDGMDIGICMFDPAEKTLSFAGANISLLTVRKGESTEIKPDKRPIGGAFTSMQNHSFITHSLPAGSGDLCCYMYSDGYADQFGGMKGKKFLRKNLKKILAENHSLSFDNQLQDLNRHHIEWRGNHEQVDDILVAGFRI